MKNITAPVNPNSKFPSVAQICSKFTKWFDNHNPNMGGSIIGSMAEDIISEYDFDDWDTWIEYVYECSAYWADIHNIDC